MSLLHKALKKAEREGEPRTISGPLVDVEEGEGRPKTRVYFLIGLVALTLSVFTYVRFFKKADSFSFVPKQFSTPLNIAGGPSSQAMAKEAQQLIQSGKYEEAMVRLEKVVILEPRNAEAYNNLGVVLKKLGKTEEAFEQYKKALSLEAQCAECLNNLGVLYLSNRDLAEAEVQFQKALQSKLDYADPYFHLGMLYEARGERAKAKENYLKFMELAKGVGADFLLKVQSRVASLQTS